MSLGLKILKVAAKSGWYGNLIMWMAGGQLNVQPLLSDPKRDSMKIHRWLVTFFFLPPSATKMENRDADFAWV